MQGGGALLLLGGAVRLEVALRTCHGFGCCGALLKKPLFAQTVCKAFPQLRLPGVFVAVGGDAVDETPFGFSADDCAGAVKI